jgi:hypothetical protein
MNEATIGLISTIRFAKSGHFRAHGTRSSGNAALEKISSQDSRLNGDEVSALRSY